MPRDGYLSVLLISRSEFFSFMARRSHFTCGDVFSILGFLDYPVHGQSTQNSRKYLLMEIGLSPQFAERDRDAPDADRMAD